MAPSQPISSLASRPTSKAEARAFGWRNLVGLKMCPHHQSALFNLKLTFAVLPKFSVELQTPDFMLQSDALTLTLVSKYTHGKGLPGRYELSIGDIYGNPQPIPFSNFGPSGPVPTRPGLLVKTGQLDPSGKTVVSVSNQELRRLAILGRDELNTPRQRSLPGFPGLESPQPDYGTYINIKAKVIEALTGHRG